MLYCTSLVLFRQITYLVNMIKVVFPGSFDPPTNGHLSIIRKASELFDEVDVVIAVNPDKKYMFTQEERVEMMEEIVRPFKNVQVHVCNDLIVKYAERTGAKVLLRGIRNAVDFTYEFELSMLNQSLSSGIQTLFIPTEQKYMLLKSSVVKELLKFHGNVSEMVPPCVENKLKEKFV